MAESPTADAESPTADAIADAVEAAQQRLAGLVLATPLVPSEWLSDACGADVRLKLENVQHTGSFKLRGASNALVAMSDTERARGVVTASSGNHGLGVAHAARRLGIAARVFVPSTTPAGKREAIRRLGADVVVHGDDCVRTEAHARAVADDSGARYLSPYNDVEVLAGQGTIMAELLRDWPDVDVVYVALGGGGLISGMAGYARRHAAGVEFVACSPRQSPAMAECVRRGRIVDVPCGETWSDSTAGGVEPGAITFALCRELVRRYEDIAEEAIAAAMRDALRHQHLLVEGAAGVAIAACRQDARLAGRNAAVVVCGGNLPFELLQRLLA